MFKQIRREDSAKSLQESFDDLEVDMTLLENTKIVKTPKPTKPSKVLIPDDMQDNVYAAILTDIPPAIPKSPSRIKISSPKQIIPKTPVSVPRTPVSVPKTPVSVPRTPVSIIKTPIQNPKTPIIVPKTPVVVKTPRSTNIPEEFDKNQEQKQEFATQSVPTREEIRASLKAISKSNTKSNVGTKSEPIETKIIEIKTPKKSTTSKTKLKELGMYKNDLPPTEFDPGLETIEFIDTPKRKKSKAIIAITNEPVFDMDDEQSKTKSKSKSKSKPKTKSEPVVDEAYIKQHTIDMEYVEITDPEQVRLDDHIKYLNKDGKLMHAFVRDKYKDKETDTYKFKVTIQQNGGFGWTVNYGNIQKMWRRPMITTSLEQTIEYIGRFLDMKFEGEFTEFARDPDRFIEIFNRLKKI
jgi:aarF domain-containing kinase